MDHVIHIFGIKINVLTMRVAVKTILAWIKSADRTCHYVVTPNVNHVVKLQHDQEFKAAYDKASMVVVDGKPVLWSSWVLRKALPETIPGSDLCPAVFNAAKSTPGFRVYLLGAAEGVAERAAKNIEARWPWINVCGYYSPPMGFHFDAKQNEQIVDRINAVKPDLLIIGLGAPKQEIWAHEMCDRLQVKVALCIGATIDFLANEKKRAPRWMNSMGLEWLHRVSTEPKRLAGRYWHDAKVFPKLVIAELFPK